MIRLIVFDCDGTLVDSQHLIVAAMEAAFHAHGMPPAPADAVRHVVGLSLAEAVAGLLPEASLPECIAIAETYKRAFDELRRSAHLIEPLFAGAREVLHELDRRGHFLGVATGKSVRGVTAVLEHHGLAHLFVSVQTADHHPSKPHPGMLEQIMRDTGSRPEETVLVGDTTYDVAMARAARARVLGVAWGYHPADALRHAGADHVLETFPELLDVIDASR